MPLVFRKTKPCRTCEGMHTCPVLLAEVEEAVARLERVACLAGKPLPDAEVIVDCFSFKPMQARAE
jgi:hypothetical protein